MGQVQIGNHHDIRRPEAPQDDDDEVINGDSGPNAGTDGTPSDENEDMANGKPEGDDLTMTKYMEAQEMDSMDSQDLVVVIDLWEPKANGL